MRQGEEKEEEERVCRYDRYIGDRKKT